MLMRSDGRFRENGEHGKGMAFGGEAVGRAAALGSWAFCLAVGVWAILAVWTTPTAAAAVDDSACWEGDVVCDREVECHEHLWGLIVHCTITFEWYDGQLPPGVIAQ